MAFMWKELFLGQYERENDMTGTTCILPFFEKSFGVFVIALV